MSADAKGRPSSTGVVYALLAAVFFGASTPLAKLLLREISPVLLAGLLYLGSGVGLGTWLVFRGLIFRNPSPKEARLRRRDLPWLVAAVVTGGMLGPLLLMVGLVRTAASTASLLLNLEGVFTACLAWFVFRENFDRRIAAGMVSIALGGVLLSYSGSMGNLITFSGPLAIMGACLCWALDNNFTRKVSAADPIQIAAIKGGVAGLINCGIGLWLGARLPAARLLLTAGLVGIVGYGLSLVLFILALRHVGTARTGAYFSTAPFVGALASLVLLREPVTGWFGAAGLLMAVGVWLHLTERHEHAHSHEDLLHEHLHRHDEHHQHTHVPTDPPGEPHSHLHHHERLVHSHPHYPDIHHHHQHERGHLHEMDHTRAGQG